MAAAEDLFMYLFSINQLVLVIGIVLIVIGLIRLWNKKGSGNPDPNNVPPNPQDPNVLADAIAVAMVNAGIKGGDTYHAPVYKDCKVKIVDYSNSTIKTKIDKRRKKIVNKSSITAEQWNQFFTAQSLNQDILQQILLLLKTGGGGGTTININNNITNYFTFILLHLGIPTQDTPADPDCKTGWAELLKRRKMLLNQLHKLVQDHKGDKSAPSLSQFKNNAHSFCSFLTIYLKQEVKGTGRNFGGRVINLEGKELDVPNPFMVLNDPFIVYHSELWRGEVTDTVRNDNYARSRELHLGPAGNDYYTLAKALHDQWLKLYNCTDESDFVTEYENLFNYLEKLVLALAAHYNILRNFTDDQIIDALFCINRVQQNLLHYRLFNTVWEFEKQPIVPYHDVDAWWVFWTTHKNGIQHLWNSQAFKKLGTDLNVVTTPDVLESRVNLTMTLFKKYDRGSDLQCDYGLRDGISFMYRFLSDDSGYRYGTIPWFDGRIIFNGLKRVYDKHLGQPEKYKHFHDMYETLVKDAKSNADWTDIQRQLLSLDRAIKTDIEYIRDTVYPLLNPDKDLYSDNTFRVALMASIDEAKKLSKWDISKLGKLEDTCLGLPMLSLSHKLGPDNQPSTTVTCQPYIKNWYDYWTGSEGHDRTVAQIQAIVNYPLDNATSTWDDYLNLLLSVEALFRIVDKGSTLRDGFQSLALYVSQTGLSIGPNLQQLLTKIYSVPDYRKNHDVINDRITKLIDLHANMVKNKVSKGSVEERTALDTLFQGAQGLQQHFSSGVAGYQQSKGLYPKLDDVLCKEIEFVFEHAKQNNRWSDKNVDGTPGITWDRPQLPGYTLKDLEEHDVPLPPPKPQIDRKCSPHIQKWYDTWMKLLDLSAGTIEYVTNSRAAQMGSWEGLHKIATSYVATGIRVVEATGEQIPVDGFEALYVYLTKLKQNNDPRLSADVLALYAGLEEIYGAEYRGWADHINSFLGLLEKNNGYAADNHTKGSEDERLLFEQTRSELQKTIAFFDSEPNRLRGLKSKIAGLWSKHGCLTFESALLMADSDNFTDYKGRLPGLKMRYPLTKDITIRELQEREQELIDGPTETPLGEECTSLIEEFAMSIDSRIKELKTAHDNFVELELKEGVTENEYRTFVNQFRTYVQRCQMSGYYLVSGKDYEADLLLYVLSGMKKMGGGSVDQHAEILQHVKTRLNLNSNESYAILMEAQKRAGKPGRQLVHFGEEFYRDSRGHPSANVHSLISIAFPTGTEKDVWGNAHKAYGGHIKKKYDDKQEEFVAYVQLLNSFKHEIQNEISVLEDVYKLFNKGTPTADNKVICEIVCALWPNLPSLVGTLEPFQANPFISVEDAKTRLAAIHALENKEKVFKDAKLSHRQKRFMEDVLEHGWGHKVEQFDVVLRNQTSLLYADAKALESLVGQLEPIVNDIKKDQSGKLSYKGSADFKQLSKDLNTVLSGGTYTKITRELGALQDLMGPAGKALQRGQAVRYSYYTRFKRNYKELEAKWGDVCHELNTLSRMNGKRLAEELLKTHHKLVDEYTKGESDIEKMAAEEKYCNDRILEVIHHLPSDQNS